MDLFKQRRFPIDRLISTYAFTDINRAVEDAEKGAVAQVGADLRLTRSEPAMNLQYDKLWIGGQWVAPSSTQVITPVDPSTKQRIGSVPEAVEADVDAAVAAACRAFDNPYGWAGLAPAQRAEAMERLADEIDARSAGFVERVSAQNGKPAAVAGMLETGRRCSRRRRRSSRCRPRRSPRRCRRPRCRAVRRHRAPRWSRRCRRGGCSWRPRSTR
ncbi:aldehyde dehydrogenase family protein [Lentzea albida]|uniref:aldehyde dehydrogenase family protein n=1 Tax=Lentzea albida TaxID=65499 RepID=UPI001FE62074|nr:aldehyde dehydrogenase family protein [Lentzea albida]